MSPIYNNAPMACQRYPCYEEEEKIFNYVCAKKIITMNLKSPFQISKCVHQTQTKGIGTTWQLRHKSNISAGNNI